MKRIKHSKVKNTGLIFELLVRQVASDTMNNKNSKALNVIKKHFHSKSELSKELKLYRTVSTNKFKTEKQEVASTSSTPARATNPTNKNWVDMTSEERRANWGEILQSYVKR